MSRRTYGDENIRTIQKAKRSYYIILPIWYVRELGWKDGQKVEVQKTSKKLIIQDWKK